MHGLIYLVKNKVNGKIYIGQTTKTLDIRKRGHISSSRNIVNGTIFWSALKKYGEANFEWLIIEENIDKKYLDDREKFYIATYNSIDKKIGYNICSGGDGL
jgi:group I intron endonuclease